MLRTLLPAFLAAVGTVAFASETARAGDPKTPLGRWMKPNMGAPLAGSDFDKLKVSFDVVSGKPPPGDYPRWAEISAAGSKASAAKDLPGIKAACKQCHDAYKTKYQSEFPVRPYP
jgi:hypothetical protein